MSSPVPGVILAGNAALRRHHDDGTYPDGYGAAAKISDYFLTTNADGDQNAIPFQPGKRPQDPLPFLNRKPEDIMQTDGVTFNQQQSSPLTQLSSHHLAA